MKANFNFIKQLILTSFKASLALRSAFIMQMLFMIINNFIFFMLWWILFERYNELNGWTLTDVKALYGLGAGSWGVTIIFARGSTFLADKIISGELDSYLIQPKSALFHNVFSKSSPSGWGDLISAFILFHWAGYLTMEYFPLLVILLISGSAIILATIIMANNLAFWFGNMEGFQNSIYEFLILFSTYPEGLFDGFVKIVLFTVIPAGFVSYLPASLLREFDFLKLILCLLAAIFYITLSWAMFTRGLKKYESGNLMVSGNS